MPDRMVWRPIEAIMAQRKSTKVVSKKHLARLERERRQTRAIIIGSVVILAIVILSIVYGILNETVLQNYKTIVTVNGDEVTVREFVSRTKATREQLVNQYVYYYQLAMMFGMDPSTDSQLTQLFTNIQNQLDSPQTMANQVITNIEDDLLIKQYAIAHGITVTSEDVETEIQNTYNFFPNGTLTPTPTATLVTYPTLSAAQLALVTATPTLEPTFTPTRNLTATAAPQGTPVPTSTPAPSATPITEEGFTQLYQEALDHYASLGFNEQMFRTVFFENVLYRERVKAMVTATVPHEAEQVWVRHILVADQTTADEVYALLKAGEDFATLAATYSTDSSKDNGGDIGWISKGATVPEFETAAFSMDVGEISEPVQSQYGYHIIQVLGHEMRPLSADEYSKAVDDAFNAFLDELRNAATIEVDPTYLSYLPTKPDLQDAFNNMFATQTAAAPIYDAEQQTLDAAMALTPSSTPVPPTAVP
jgi:peptidyl-prolyl cis-trans isomerase D